MSGQHPPETVGTDPGASTGGCEVPGAASDDRRAVLVGLALVAVAALAGFGSTLDQALLGWDTFPVIESAAVRGWSDVLGLLTDDYLGGYHGGARFLRPLSSGLLALDHALHGVDPPGYQATSLVCHAVASGLVYLLGRAWFGGGWPPVVAAMIFAVHPAHWEAVPFASRRSEILLLVTGCGALLARERERPVLAAVLVLVSLLAKETGAVFGAAVLWRCLPDRGALLRQTGWLAVIAGPYLAYRLFVFGVGGYDEAAPAPEAPLPFFDALSHLHLTGGARALVPGGVANALPWGVAAGLLPTAAVSGWRRGSLRLSWWTSGPAMPVVVWVGLLVFHLALVPGFASWYAYVPIGFACIGLGGVVQAAVGDIERERRSAARRPAVMGLSIATLLCAAAPALTVLGLATSEEHEARMRLATRTQDQYLGILDETLQRCPTGSVIRIRPSAVSIGGKAWGPERRAITLLANYSLEAWGRLVRPDHPLVGVRAGEIGSVARIDGVHPTTVEMFFDHIPFEPGAENRPPPMGVDVLLRKE